MNCLSIYLNKPKKYRRSRILSDPCNTQIQIMKRMYAFKLNSWWAHCFYHYRKNISGNRFTFCMVSAYVIFAACVKLNSIFSSILKFASCREESQALFAFKTFLDYTCRNSFCLIKWDTLLKIHKTA